MITLYAVLDGTHYPIACFHNSDAAYDYSHDHSAAHGSRCYVVRTNLHDDAPAPMHEDDVKQAYRDGVFSYDEAINRLHYDNRMSLASAITFCPE